VRVRAHAALLSITDAILPAAGEDAESGAGGYGGTHTTAVLADLDLTTGLLRYVNAGHPAPVLIGDGRVVARLEKRRRMPLGLSDPRPAGGLLVPKVLDRARGAGPSARRTAGRRLP
jgi:hypothetical protein